MVTFTTLPIRGRRRPLRIPNREEGKTLGEVV